MDDAELVGEQSLVGAQELEIACDTESLPPVRETRERVAETRQHDRTARRTAYGLLEGCDRLGAASEALQRPPGEKVAPVERGFNPLAPLRLREGLGMFFPLVVAPADGSVR